MDEVIEQQKVKITSLTEESSRCTKIAGLQDKKLEIQEREIQLNLMENENEVSSLKKKIVDADTA